MNLQILPAIDLQAGACVRLEGGDFSTAKIYSEDPVASQAHFTALGASEIHVVDLDGARAGRAMQSSLIEKMILAGGVSLQIGGGIRDAATARNYERLGARRVVLGSLAVTDFAATAAIIDELGDDRVTLAFDLFASGGRYVPAIRGWQASGDKTLETLFSKYRRWPRLRYLCTDIARDGRLTGISGEFYQHLSSLTETSSLFASGGVRDERDLAEARKLGLGGVIVGRSFYEGTIDLGAAFQC